MNTSTPFTSLLDEEPPRCFLFLSICSPARKLALQTRTPTKQKCAQKHEEKRQVYNTISPKRKGISQICDVATVVQEELPKFGYRSEMTVEIFKNATFFWRPTAETCV
jgi:hypothetical protein